MSSLNEIRKRIRTVESTSKITNAMKLVATAKLKKQKAMFESQEVYYRNFYEVFAYIKNHSEDKSFSVKKPNANKTIWIVFYSNMGLCGSYNLNITKELEAHIKPEDELYIIGRKGKALLKSKNISNKILLNLELDDKDVQYDLFYVLSENILKQYKNDKSVGSFKILYTKFVNSLSFVAQTFSLLPLDEKIKSKKLDKPYSGGVYYFEPNHENFLASIMVDYIATCLYGAILESKVCENASRRNAMDSATKNADELIKNYKLEFNRKRQSDITQEIAEVVSGSTNTGE